MDIRKPAWFQGKQPSEPSPEAFANECVAFEYQVRRADLAAIAGWSFSLGALFYRNPCYNNHAKLILNFYCQAKEKSKNPFQSKIYSRGISRA